MRPGAASQSALDRCNGNKRQQQALRPACFTASRAPTICKGTQAPERLLLACLAPGVGCAPVAVNGYDINHFMCNAAPAYSSLVANHHLQIGAKIVAGERPVIPPREELPGPDSATFAGLEAYCQLVR